MKTCFNQGFEVAELTLEFYNFFDTSQHVFIQPLRLCIAEFSHNLPKTFQSCAIWPSSKVFVLPEGYGKKGTTLIHF